MMGTVLIMIGVTACFVGGYIVWDALEDND